MKAALIEYITNDGITHSLDIRTNAKQGFLNAFEKYILKPRNLNHKLHFTGPTGANAVEAVIKLARKVTGRKNIVGFTNAFHGCSLGALSLTANRYNRESSVSMLSGVHRALYDGYLGNECDTSEILRKQLSDSSGGVDKPAAIVLEIVQGEGGLNAASKTGCKT